MNERSSLTRVGALVGLAIVCAASQAGAQVTAQEKAVADSFFNDGVKALRAGKLEEACAKLAESEKIEPAVGTALYLGDCYERSTKIASAQAMFQEAFDLAKRRSDGRAAAAKEKHDKLSPSTLVVKLAPGAALPGLEVKCDDVALSNVAFDTPIPLDGGSHALEVTAPGKKPYTTSFSLAPKEESATKTIPVLEDAPAVTVPETTAHASSGETAPPASSATLSPMRIAGIVLGGVGVATLVVGAVAGATAISDWSASNDPAQGNCVEATTQCRTQQGIDLRGSASTWATVSNVTFAAGGALVVVGAVLFLAAPKHARASASRAWYVVPTVGSSGSAVVAGGSF